MKDLKKKFRRFSKDKEKASFIDKYWPVAAILLLVFAFFWKVFLLKQVPFPGDFVVGIYYPWLDYKWGYPAGVPVKNPITADVPSFIYPMQTLAADLMKKGEWPLWNPHILAGAPLLANFQSASFSPTILVYFLFDKITAWSVQIILQHVLVATFTYFLLRYWKVSKLGSLVGGVIFAFSGFNLIWSQWNGHALTASFIPLLLLFEDRWLKKGKFLDGAGLAFALCFQVLSGYPQVVLYTAVAAGILWLVRIWGEKKWLLKTVFLGVFFAIGLGLSGLQLLPGAELLSLSQWTAEPHPFDWAFLPWNKVITFFAPDYFGNHSTQNYWGPQDYTSNTGFAGVVAFVLAGFSLPFLKKKKEVVFSLLLLAITLILSFPTPLSIFFWKNNLFGMRSSSAHRALVLFNLSIGLLAGFGTDYFLKFKPTRRQAGSGFKYKRPLALPYLVIGGYGVYTFALYYLSQQSPEIYEPLVRGIPKYWVGLKNLVLPTGFLIATTIALWTISRWKKLKTPAVVFLSFLLILELFRFGWKFTPFSPRDLVFPKTPILDFLTSQEKPFRISSSRVIPVNLAMPYGLESLEGYETMRPASSSQFLASLNQNRSTADPAGRYGIIDNDTSHLLDLVNTKYYLTLKRDEKNEPSSEGEIPDRFKTKRFKLAFEDKTTVVLESKTALPRAFMVYDWQVIKNSEEILNKLLDPKFPMESKVILEEVPVEVTKATKGAGVSEVKYSAYDEQKSVIDLKTEKEGMLFVSDAWYPEWKAFVDGQETKIYRANYAFRGVPVPAGEYEVRFIYQPESFSDGLKISVFSVIILAAFFFSYRYLGRKNARGYT